MTNDASSIRIRISIEELIKEMFAARQVNKNYGPSHELTKESIKKLLLKLESMFSTQPEITIGIIGNEIAFEKEPFYELSKNMKDNISHLKELKIERISFLRGTKEKELLSLLDIINMSAEAVEKAGGVKRLADSLGMKTIVFSRLGTGSSNSVEEETDSHTLARQNIQEVIQFLEKTSDDIQQNQRIDAQLAYLLINRIISNLLKNKESLLILSSLKSHDEYTFLHSLNVAILTLVQAEAFGIQGAHLTEIGVAALLHDSGKLVLSGDIIRKKEKLLPDEFGRIRQHPLDGAKILFDSPEINPLSALVSFEHHIGYNAEGYPQRLYGGKPNLVSMMVSISDFYDALRSKRSYHDEMAPEKVYEEITKVAGSQLHPELVENFFGILGVYPPGTLVELDDKSIGLVIKESALDIRRPQVELLYATDGQKVNAPYVVNLLEKDKDSGKYKWSIVKSLAVTEKIDLPDKYHSA